jgi:hypothetical protein
MAALSLEREVNGHVDAGRYVAMNTFPRSQNSSPSHYPAVSLRPPSSLIIDTDYIWKGHADWNAEPTRFLASSVLAILRVSDPLQGTLSAPGTSAGGLLDDIRRLVRPPHQEWISYYAEDCPQVTRNFPSTYHSFWNPRCWAPVPHDQGGRVDVAMIVGRVS